MKGNLAVWLADEQPEIVLLHIGTNGLDPSPDDVEAILDDIDLFSPNVWVVLARIINISCITDNPSCPDSVTTMNFNINVANMAQARILAGDKIIIVDMENGAGIDYHLTTDNPPGDMWDNYHPFETGYAKMANLWFSALEGILPQADAGPDQSKNEFEPVTLDALASSDPKGGNLSYQWVQTAGNPVVDLLPDDQAPQPTFDAPDAGPTGKTLTFTLTVTDEDGLVSTDTVDITLAKIAPQADAGPNQTVYESTTVTLDASGSVGGGLTYQWTQTAGTSVVLNDNHAIQPFFVAPEDVVLSGETLIFELAVTDDDGLESKDTVDIAVKILPQADAGPDQSVNEFDTVTLDASGSVAASALSYQWTQTVGTDVGQFDAQAVQPSFIAPDVAPGDEILTFELKITDEDDLESTDTVDITVSNPTSPDSGDGGGGGGGGGCFIATVADGSPMALNGMLNWKQRLSGYISLLAPRAERAATPALVVTMVVLIGVCLANTLRKPRKK